MNLPAIVFSLLGGILSFAAPQAQEPGAVVEGVAFRASTQQPVKNAVLTLAGAQRFYATTDREGRFSIKGVPPGAYTATLEHEAYFFPPDALARRSVTVGAQGSVQLSYPLIAGGVIAGRLLTPEGRPLVNITVSANLESGVRVQSATTNDRGEYRLFWLRPGNYYISAAAPNPDAVGSFASAKDQYANTAFPNATDRAAGLLINVREGAATAADSFSMQALAQRAVTISGVGESNTFLVPRDENRSVRAAGPGGAFQFRAVAPGDYDVLTTFNLTFPERARSGLLPLTVENEDLSDLRIPTTSAVDLSGRIRFVQDDPAVPSDRLGQLRVEIRPVKAYAELLPSPAFAPVSADGDFRISRVFQGRYTVSVSGLPAGVVVRELRAGAQRIDPSNLAITSMAPTALDIVLGPP